MNLLQQQWVTAQFPLKALVAVISMVAVLCLFGLLPDGPAIQGKTPRQWARYYLLRPTDFEDAPPEVKPAIIPYLIRELNVKAFPGERLFAIYEWMHEHAPEPVAERLPELLHPDERRLHAVLLLGDLGPLASSAVTSLIPLLYDDTLRGSAALTHAAMGPAAGPAVPRLLDLILEDPEPLLATALARLAPADAEVIRTLGELSRTGPDSVRKEAAAGLKLCVRSVSNSMALLQMEASELSAGQGGRQ